MPVNKEARELAEEYGVKIFTADVIYHLFDQFGVRGGGDAEGMVGGIQIAEGGGTEEMGTQFSCCGSGQPSTHTPRFSPHWPGPASRPPLGPRPSHCVCSPLPASPSSPHPRPT